MKVTLTAVSRKDRVSKKTNKPFVSLGIKTREHGEDFLSGFGNASNAGWSVGDTVEIDVEKKGEYLNFEMPKNANGTDKPSRNAEMASSARLENIISLRLIPAIEALTAALEAKEGYPARDEENTPNF